MKNAIIILLLAISKIASATDYYISATGNDASDGRSISTPWKTISKVNSTFSAFIAGDKVLFNRGDTFYGTLKITKSGSAGSPITIGAYGTGANPILTGFTTITGWTSIGGGIYSKVLTCESPPNIVVVNGVNTPMGRYPDSGWLSIDSHSTNISITDAALSSSPDWDGAEVVIRKNRWIIDRNLITNHSGSSISYTTASSYNAIDGYGYLIQNDLETLTTNGEWYYDAVATKFYMFFGTVDPSTVSVKVGTLDKIVSNMTYPYYNYIVMENLDLQGANKRIVDLQCTSYFTIQNCVLRYSGTTGIFGTKNGGTSSNYFTLKNSTITDCNNSAVEIGKEFQNALISNNTISNIGTIRGMGGSADGIHQTGIGILGAFATIVEYNTIYNIGYIPIVCDGSNGKIRNNFIQNFCNVKDDGGGIYTSTALYTGREITNNIVLYGIGAPDGTTASYGAAHGIYLDDRSTDIIVSGNTCALNASSGGYVHNAIKCSVQNNTFFNNEYQVSIVHDNYASDYPIRNITLKHNIFFAKASTQRTLRTSSLTNDFNQFGILDSNYYARPVDESKTLNVSINWNGSNRTLPDWKSLYLHDPNSQISPILLTDTVGIALHYNATKSDKVVSLDLPMVDVKGKKYVNNIRLLPFTSAVLMIDPNPAPPPLPVLNGAVINNATPGILEMTYDLSLANSAPPNSAFTVMVNSVSRTVSSVSISGNKVLLTLSSPVIAGNIITVAYTKPATNPIQTTAGGIAASIATLAVTNNCSAVDPVYLSSVAENATPALLEITYDLSLTNVLPATSAFVVLVNSVDRTVNSVAIVGGKVRLTLSSPVVFGNVVTVAYTIPGTNPLQTASGGVAASITAVPVTNNCAAALPVFVSAVVENTSPAILEMTYDLALANVVSATSSFVLQVNSVNRIINSVTIVGGNVRLSLATPIIFGDVVTIAYTKPASNPIQTASGGLAASITSKSVTNNCIAALPVFVSAAVENITPSIVEISYDLSLANIVPSTSSFNVQINSSARTINSVSIVGGKVRLTLGSPAIFGDVITVSYTKPASNPLQTAPGGLAESITLKVVTNNILADPPVFLSAVVENATPSIIEMTYDLSLANIIPALSSFIVQINSSPRTVNSAGIVDGILRLTLASPAAYGDVITVAYNKPAINPLQSVQGGTAATISSRSVINNCSSGIPIFSSAVVENSTPSILEMTYDLDLANIVPDISAFSVLINSVSRNINSVAVVAGKVQLTLASPAVFGDIITIEYTKPALNPLQTVLGGEAASLSQKPVTNNCSAGIPIFVSAAVENATPNILEMTYDLSITNIVPAITAYNVQVNSAAVIVNLVSIVGGKVRLTLANPAIFGDIITVAYTKPLINPLQTALGGEAGTISAQDVLNNINSPLPVFVSAIIENVAPSILEMTYDLYLANSIPPFTSFVVQVNSTVRTINSVTVVAGKVQLNLSSPVLFGDVITVSYIKPSSNPLQTAFGGEAVTISAKSVTNNLNAAIPAFVSAVIEDATPSILEMSYDLNLTNIVPAFSTFTVQINSVSRTINSVAIVAGKVRLTLAIPVVFGDIITVAYSKPVINPLQTAVGGEAADLIPQSVTNNRGAVLPVFVSAVVENATPDIVEMTYDLSLTNSVPSSASFSVQINSASRTINSVEIVAGKVSLNLSSPVVYGDIITVSYTKPSINPLQTPSGGEAATISQRFATNNCTVAIPVLISAIVDDTTPTLVELTFDLGLINNAPVPTDFDIRNNSVSKTIQSVEVIGDKVRLIMLSAVFFGDIITFSYTKPPINALQTASGGVVANISGQQVENNVNPVKPVYLSSVIEYANPDILKMSFDIGVTEIIPEASAFSVLVNGIPRNVSSVTIDARNVRLTLQSGVVYGDIITLSYTEPASNPLQTRSGGVAESIINQAVINNCIDLNRPNDPPTIVLNYEENSFSGFVYEIDASGSFDLDNDSISYDWTVPEDVDVSQNGLSKIRYLAPVVKGSRVIEFQVRANDIRVTASKTIQINIAPYKPELSNARIPSIFASDYTAPDIPKNVLDDNLSTKWSVRGDNQYLLFELAVPFKISHLNLVFLPGQNFESYFDVFASKDNVNWKTILSKVASCSFSGDNQVFDFPAAEANTDYSYVKLVGRENSVDTWNTFSEVTIFGALQKNPGPGESGKYGVDYSGNRNVVIYPNPARDYFKISIEEPTIEPDIINIIDVAGRVVYENTVEPGIKIIHIPPGFRTGSYVVELRLGKLILDAQKLVIIE